MIRIIKSAEKDKKDVNSFINVLVYCLLYTHDKF